MPQIRDRFRYNRRGTVLLSGRMSIILLVALSGMFFLTGCDSSDDTDSVPDSGDLGIMMESLEFPALWVSQSETFRAVTAEISLSQSWTQAIENGTESWPVVYLLLVPVDNQAAYFSVQLSDDGGGSPLDSASTPDFQTTWSGDLIPHDLQYSTNLNSFFADQSGQYLVGVYSPSLGYTPGGDLPDALSLEPDYYLVDTVMVTNNAAPFISSLTLPDSLPSGFEEQTWTVEVVDPDADFGDWVENVSMDMYHNYNLARTLQFTKVQTGIWTFSVDASFAAAYPSDEYIFIVNASDRFGNVADSNRTVWMENLPAVTSNFTTPDTVVVPLEGANLYVMTVEVHDPQTDLDIESVYYEVMRPGESVWLGDESFTFNDSGPDNEDSQDEVAGDHIWTAGIITVSTNNNFGTFHFRVIARDRAGNESEPIVRDIVMVQEEGL